MNAKGYAAILGMAMMITVASVGNNVAAQVASSSSATSGKAPAEPKMARARARSDYIEYCAGCHGVTGSSRPAKVPVLRDRIGYFLCLPQGREYLIRLPNVANAAVDDDAALAELMNYVVAEFGGVSSPFRAAPYTTAEVSAWRRTPLTRTSLVRFRSDLVARMRRQCRNVPAAIEKFS